MCLILVDCENVSNSFEVNCSLLSEMICLGDLCCETSSSALQ